MLSVHGTHKVNVAERRKQESPDMREKESSWDTTTSINDILNVDADNVFEPIHSVNNGDGTTTWRARQMYKGLEVFGAAVVYAVDESGHYTGSVSGAILENIQEDIPDVTICLESEDELLALALVVTGMENGSLVLHYSQRIIYLEDLNSAHLAYILDLTSVDLQTAKRPYLIVSACDHSVFVETERITTHLPTDDSIDRQARKQPKDKNKDKKKKEKKEKGKKNPTDENNDETEPEPETETETETETKTETGNENANKCLKDASGTGGNAKTGDINYGTKSESKDLCLNVNIVDSVCQLTSPDVQVYDMQQSYKLPKNEYEYDCRKANDQINSANSPNLDGFFYAQKIYDMFREIYKRAPLKGSIVLGVHYGKNIGNAYWFPKFVCFGDGNNKYYPFVSLDIVAHEIAHGILEENSKLIYKAESGGLNEAFADITGEAMEQLSDFYNGNKWETGSDILKKDDSIRYFAKKVGSNINHMDDYYNGMSVHHSSGIISKAFFNLVETEMVDMVDAYGSVLDANILYWGPKTGFREGACDIKRAGVARKVPGHKFDSAFRDVGIDTTCCSIDQQTLQEKTLNDVIVSADENPCFTILPYEATRKSVGIKAGSIDGENAVLVHIDIVAFCGDASIKNDEGISYDLLDDNIERVVCFSSDSELKDVEITVKYCSVTGLCN